MRSPAEICLEISQLSQKYMRDGIAIPEEKVFSLVVESIEAQPSTAHKIAVLRSFVRGRMNIPALPEDIALLEIPEHQA